MAQPTKHHQTLEAYLAHEAVSAEKSEYHRGIVTLMSGGTLNHSAICVNLIGELRNVVRPVGCRAFNSDLRVYISREDLATYPDLSIICCEPEFLAGRDDTVLNPKLIIEVLSDSTERYDRGRKFQLYPSLPSLEHYLLVSQHDVSVDYFRRAADVWELRSFTKTEQSIEVALPAASPH